MASGKLQPNISLELPISDVAAAHRQQEAATLRSEGSLAGKIVLTFTQENQASQVAASPGNEGYES